MVRDRLNKIFSSKAFYIVFALLVSIALWVFIELSLNPTSRWTITEVPIVYLNVDLLHDKNLVITGTDTENITLRFDCKRELQRSLTNATVYVTVDLANITKPGSSYQTYDIVLPQGIARSQLTNLTRSVNSINISVDRQTQKTIPIVGEYKGGTASEDLFADPVIFDPNTLIVYGPEEAVSRVDHAFVEIKRENLSSTVNKDDEVFILQDVNNEPIDDATLDVLICSQDTVSYTIPIKQIKDVPLTVEPIYGAGANVQNTRITTNPQTIQIIGDPDIVSDINSLPLGAIDLTKFDSTTTEVFQIIVPNNVTYQQGVTEAYVTVEIIGLETRHYLATNLQTVNAPKGLTPIIQTSSLDIKIRGQSHLLDAILPENIIVIADLTDYKEGGSSVLVKISILGDIGDIGTVGGEYRIPITLVKES